MTQADRVHSTPPTNTPIRVWTAITSERTRLAREELADQISRIDDDELRARLRQRMSALFLFLEDDLQRGSAAGAVRQPLELTKDDELGMAWWNGLTERERAHWAALAGTGRVKDAWEMSAGVTRTISAAGAVQLSSPPPIPASPSGACLPAPASVEPSPAVATYRPQAGSVVSRRSILNIIASTAAVAAATTTAAPAMAADWPVGKHVASDVSFPELLGRFVRIRERWSSQVFRDKAWSDKIDQLLFEATGVTRSWRGQLRYDDPAFAEIDRAHAKIMQENPSNDPVDEHGASIAWDEIFDELYPVVRAMLNCAPRSVADLGWQTEAVLILDAELREGPDLWNQYPELPQLIENIRKLAGPLSIPSIIPPLETVDPIFAAIEAHTKAREAFEAQCIASEDDDGPIQAANEAADDAAIELLRIQPTTLAGASALLVYFGEMEGDGMNTVFPETADYRDDGEIAFHAALALHVSETIKRIGGIADDA